MHDVNVSLLYNEKVIYLADHAEVTLFAENFRVFSFRVSLHSFLYGM